MLASFACNPNNSKGRLHPERLDLSISNAFEIDRSRIIESTAFRRLEYKTQVFINHEGDHFRNRLTHTLEAAEIARIVSKALNVSVDLSEILTLAHDLGHAAFGHAGEDALNEAMQEYGLDFDHNSHTIKLLSELENKYPKFNGLNLSWETLEGIAKHNGPILKPSKIILDYSKQYNVDLKSFSSLEAQISSVADDIAYNNHDIDDGFRSGLLSLEDLRSVSLLGKIITQVELEYSGVEKQKILHESIRRIKKMMILDLIRHTEHNIKKHAVETSEDIRSLGLPLAEFSEEMEVYHQEIKKFLMSRVYQHNSIMRTSNKAKRIIKELFHLYMNDVSCLPNSWKIDPAIEKQDAAIIVSDFIACMSDRYAISEYRSFFELS